MKIDRNEIRVWEPLLIGLAAAIGLIVGYNVNFDNDNSSLLSIEKNEYKSTISHGDGRIEEILRFVESKYVDSIESEKITLNLIDEMLGQLDPHSSYITPEDLADYNEKMKGRYRGIGIETLLYQDTFYITKLVESGPAADAGVKVGDAILEINGNKVSGSKMESDQVRDMLKDSTGSNLLVTIKPIGVSTTKELEIEAKDIIVPSAEVCYMLNDKTAYLKLSRFSGNTYEQFIESIEKIKEGKKELNLVLDLRDNPGGYLPEAIKILSQLFDSKDKLLTYTEGLNRKRRDYRTTGNAFYRIDKVAVLLDKYSASGSEILAGAIQDWDRGIVIGENSYGKGLVQEIFPLKNGGALRLTVAKYYTPSGRLIQKSYTSNTNDFDADSAVHYTKVLERKVESGNGIVPDVTVESPEGCYGYQRFFDHYVLSKMKTYGSADLKRIAFSRPDYEAFVQANFREYIGDLQDSNCHNSFSTDIDLCYKRMIMTNNEFAREANVSDKSIQKAMQFIVDEKPTTALLSEKY